jgi:hypothetical protein
MRITSALFKKLFDMKQGIVILLLIIFVSGFLHSQTSIEKSHPISNTFISPFSISVIDMDNDGDNDIIAGSAYDTISWFKNDGHGNFGTPTTITTELDNVRSVFGCDMDKDGDIDVLSASKNDNVISWIENEGNNVFGSPIILSSNANYAKYVSGHDIDNDGDIDVLAGYQYKVVWFENDGSNNFGPEKIIANNTSYRMAADDIDGDGDIDIFTRITHVYNSETNLIWYKNNGDKTFSEQYVQTPFNFTKCLDVDVYDIDGDGQKDIIASFYSINSWSADKIAWFRNEGNDTFLFEGYATSNSRFPQKITAFDIDMDGDGDIFGALTESGNVKWFRNWDNSFSDKEIASGIDVTIDLAIADMDMDNDMDVIVSSSGRQKIFWIENSTLKIIDQPVNKLICPREDISYAIQVKDAEQYKWQVKGAGDNYFNDIEENEFYFGETTNELQIISPLLEMKGFQYRCKVSNEAGYLISDTLTLSMYEDMEAPVLETKDFDLYLQNAVQTNLLSGDVIESLSDNCFYTDIILSKSIFDCSDLGEESIDITAIDGSGNTITKTAFIKVIDTVSPTIQQPVKSKNIFTNKSSYTIKNDFYDLGLYYDNCEVSSVMNDISGTETLNGMELPIGKTIVNWTVTDNSGNKSNSSYEIIVTNSNEYTVYPNPFIDQLTIVPKYEGDGYSLKMVDLNGKTLFKVDNISDKKYSFDPGPLLKGYYLLQIDNGKETTETKLIKLK